MDSEGKLQGELDALRQRIAQLEAALARVEGERDEARRLVTEAFKALARDPAAELALARVEEKRRADRERQQRKAGRDARANSRDDGGGGDLEIVSVEVDPPSTSDTAARAKSRDEAEQVPPEAMRYWLWCQDQRRAAGAGVREVMPQKKRGLNFPRWFSEATAEVGVDALAEAFRAFLADRHFAHKQWCMAVFMSDQVWRQRVPRALADEHREAQLQPKAEPPPAEPFAEPPPAAARCRFPWDCSIPGCTHSTPGSLSEGT